MSDKPTISISTPDHDVSPDSAGMLAPPSGGATSEVPDKPPKRNWMDKLTDMVRGDEGIARRQGEISEINKKAADDIAVLERENFEAESKLAEQARKSDKGLQAQEKQRAVILNAQHSEARRLASLNEMISEYERRHPVKDEEVISFYQSQIQRESLWGVFSKQKGK